MNGVVVMMDPRIEFFDNHAASWDDDTQKIQATLDRLDKLGEMLPINPGQKVLEVGCGTGQITEWLAQRVKSEGCITAVDFSNEMLAKARQRNIPNFECLHFDVCVEPLPEKKFDVALCFHVFPHFRDKEFALKNIASSLKPGGKLIVLHLAGSEKINSFHTGVGGAVAHDFLPIRAEWEALAATAGLNIKKFVDKEDLFLLIAFLY
jgi:demethylmenaquinone methyltransferase/2-methoxy-6-polyprenyl-1,4-benzoquinol methylase